MSAPVVQWVDQALPDRMFARLESAIVALGAQRLRQTYQTTFWFDFEEPPSNVVEEAILHLLTRRPKGKRIIGAEWWLSRMRTSNVQVDFHRDRDERLALTTGRQVHPTVSSVLFLNRSRGGLLAVTRQAPNPANPAMAPDVLALDLVEPRPNRYAWFDGRMTHGVLDAGNQIPGKRLPTERSLRLTIAINLWKKRPLEVPRFLERKIYRSL